MHIFKTLFIIVTTLAIISCNQVDCDKILDVSRHGTVQELQSILDIDDNCLHHIDSSGVNALILAAYYNNNKVADLLIDAQININHQSPMGTALMAATVKSNTHVVKQLINQQAQLDLVDKQGKTALIYAVELGFNDIAKLLIEAGANKMIKDAFNNTAQDYALLRKNTELIILLD